jgi:hypothetical protein
MALLTSEVTRQIDPFPRLEIQVPDVAGFSRAEPRIICRREAIAANSETEEETWRRLVRCCRSAAATSGLFS